MYKKLCSSILLSLLLVVVGCTDNSSDSSDTQTTGDQSSNTNASLPEDESNDSETTPNNGKDATNEDTEDTANSSDENGNDEDTSDTSNDENPGSDNKEDNTDGSSSDTETPTTNDSSRTPYILVNLAMSLDEAMSELENPIKKETTDKGTVALLYQEQGKGVVFEQSMKDGSLEEIAFYPMYLEDVSFTVDGWSIPSPTDALLELLGDFDKKQEVQCFESATCDEYLYKRSNDSVVVRTNWDKETVEYVKITN